MGGSLGEIEFWDAGLGEWGSYYEPHPFSIIFSHSFAKSFFGEREYPSWLSDSIDPKAECSIEELPNKGWQYHLQQMVLEEEPLKYLERFLEEE